VTALRILPEMGTKRSFFNEPGSGSGETSGQWRDAERHPPRLTR
jgi:hypothetical protein